MRTWRVAAYDKTINISAGDDGVVAMMGDLFETEGPDREKGEALARFIVDACNMLEERNERARLLDEAISKVIL